MIEWAIVIMFYGPDGAARATHRTGFVSKKQCEDTMAVDLKTTFYDVPSVKGHCVDFPVKPAGLPDPQPAPKKGAVNA